VLRFCRWLTQHAWTMTDAHHCEFVIIRKQLLALYSVLAHLSCFLQVTDAPCPLCWYLCFKLTNLEHLMVCPTTYTCKFWCRGCCACRHIACAEGAYSVAQWLIETGVDPNPRDRHDRTPLEVRTDALASRQQHQQH
jgi:hypothetical protein